MNADDRLTSVYLDPDGVSVLAYADLLEEQGRLSAAQFLRAVYHADQATPASPDYLLWMEAADRALTPEVIHWLEMGHSTGMPAGPSGWQYHSFRGLPGWKTFSNFRNFRAQAETLANESGPLMLAISEIGVRQVRTLLQSGVAQRLVGLQLNVNATQTRRPFQAFSQMSEFPSLGILELRFDSASPEMWMDLAGHANWNRIHSLGLTFRQSAYSGIGQFGNQAPEMRVQRLTISRRAEQRDQPETERWVLDAITEDAIAQKPVFSQVRELTINEMCGSAPNARPRSGKWRDWLANRETITLRGEPLSADEATDWATFADGAPVHELHLRSRETIIPEVMDALVKNWPRNSHVHTLELWAMGLQPETTRQFLQWPALANVRNLDMSYLLPSEDTIEQISNSEYLNRLERLDIRSSSFAAEHLTMLSQGHGLQSLKELWLQLRRSEAEEQLQPMRNLLAGQVGQSLWRLVIETMPETIDWLRSLAQDHPMPQLRQLCLLGTTLSRKNVDQFLKWNVHPKLWRLTLVGESTRFDLIRDPELGWSPLPENYPTR
ncbi:hypothetical protein [Tuwongella immobilis]|uniref:Repeat-companion domain protein n=1 Tax=Tuwongella immobilis TaxID=692036 RepID=A0A6C2YIJ3_9BACT|nr:hypothetical protein [Tuwongella immobilis]VIP01237.1 unnamed protein product [Tuwongella immobilis]VTR97900.1 unnamed protein product [Tuwongella immobilis]